MEILILLRFDDYCEKLAWVLLGWLLEWGNMRFWINTTQKGGVKKKKKLLHSNGNDRGVHIAALTRLGDKLVDNGVTRFDDFLDANPGVWLMFRSRFGAYESGESS